MTTFLEWFKERHSEYQAVLFDIDGTMTVGQKPLPGNSETVEYLRSLGFPFFFLTNDGINTHAQKRKQLMRGGVDAREEEIVSSSDALPDVIREKGLVGRKVMLLGAHGGQEEYLERAGAVPVTPKEADECAAVFVGEGRFNWFDDIHSAVNHVRLHPEVPLIVSNPDSHWTGRADGLIGIGAGALARFMQSVLKDMGVGAECIFLGKPNPAIFLAAIERLKGVYGIRDVDKKKIIMVGDALFSDICGANRLGMTSALVMTGLTSKKQLEEAEGIFVPDIAFSQLGIGY